jgi:hypothetical protein
VLENFLYQILQEIDLKNNHENILKIIDQNIIFLLMRFSNSSLYKIKVNYKFS